MTETPSVAVSKVSLPVARISWGAPLYPDKSSPPTGDLVQHRDRVVDIGESVDPRETRTGPPGQGFHAVAGALRFGAERPIRLAPGRDMRELLDGESADRLAGSGFG